MLFDERDQREHLDRLRSLREAKRSALWSEKISQQISALDNRIKELEERENSGIAL